jgi:hypothetical protein
MSFFKGILMDVAKGTFGVVSFVVCGLALSLCLAEFAEAMRTPTDLANMFFWLAAFIVLLVPTVMSLNTAWLWRQRHLRENEGFHEPLS